MIEDAKRVGKHFQLRPFTSESLVGELALSGCIARTAGTLLIEYRLQGSLGQILWPSVPLVTGRCDELWRHSCFEVFFATKGDPAYWEANLCLSGCWNVYRFDGYRTGMQEEGGVVQPHCYVVASPDLLLLTCTMDLNGIVDDSAELEVGLSSVIEGTDGSISYWAIEHLGAVPDFHNRRSFLVLLPGLKDSNSHGD